MIIVTTCLAIIYTGHPLIRFLLRQILCRLPECTSLYVDCAISNGRADVVAISYFVIVGFDVERVAASGSGEWGDMVAVPEGSTDNTPPQRFSQSNCLFRQVLLDYWAFAA